MVYATGGSDVDAELVDTEPDTLFELERLLDLVVPAELELEVPEELAGGPAEKTTAPAG